MPRTVLNVRRIALGVMVGVAIVVMVWKATGRAQIGSISLARGFSISWYTRDVPNARSLALGANGTVFVGSQSEGSVYAVLDRDADGTADTVYIVARDLSLPNGVAMSEGALYVAEMHRIMRFDQIESRLADPPAPVVIYEDLPDRIHHGSRFIAFGPDGRLYVAVGSPCNVCKVEDERVGTIMRMNSDGTDVQIFATGIRNSVGFDFDPADSALWFTDNGRDFLGDDAPPDELNRVGEPGMNFGFPYCHGGNIQDPEFGAELSCEEFEQPVANLGPHVAALGMRFYNGNMFPAEYRGVVFIAEHGSWNRSAPVGYRLTTVRIDSTGAVAYEVFAEGWLKGRRAWGRPADVLVMPDGSMLVSDDRQGAIYRITYSEHN